MARQRWNELNVLGATATVWRALNTKQKKAVRDLLQATAPQPQESPHESVSEQGEADREAD